MNYMLLRDNLEAFLKVHPAQRSSTVFELLKMVSTKATDEEREIRLQGGRETIPFQDLLEMSDNE